DDPGRPDQAPAGRSAGRGAGPGVGRAARAPAAAAGGDGPGRRAVAGPERPRHAATGGPVPGRGGAARRRDGAAAARAPARPAAGNVLVVTDTESSARPAAVHFPDLSLIGPRITIDQVENVAEVEGAGSMRLLTQSDMSGKKLARPTELKVYWKQSMHFGG